MRDLISLVCDGCKRKNYTSTKNKKKTTEKLAFRKFCPVLPQPRGAQGGEGLTVTPRRQGVSSSNW